MNHEFQLQMFADAGTLVNATGNYVNAYTGATTAFSGADSLSSAMKTFYDTELLENARPELIHAQFARKQPLPAGRGKSGEQPTIRHAASSHAGQQDRRGAYRPQQHVERRERPAQHARQIGGRKRQQIPLPHGGERGEQYERQDRRDRREKEPRRPRGGAQRDERGEQRGEEHRQNKESGRRVRIDRDEKAVRPGAEDKPGIHAQPQSKH